MEPFKKHQFISIKDERGDGQGESTLGSVG